MEFPTKDFMVINSNKIKPIMYEKYSDKCKCYPLISDENGERWICEFKKGFKLLPHKHEGRYEWYVMSGKYVFRNPETKRECILEEGDYYVNPENVIHEEECLEDGKILWIYNKKENHNH